MTHQISLILYGPNDSIDGARSFLEAKMECAETIKTTLPKDHLIVEFSPKVVQYVNADFESIVDSLGELQEAGLLTDQIDRAISIIFTSGNGGITIGKNEIRKCFELDLYLVING